MAEDIHASMLLDWKVFVRTDTTNTDLILRVVNEKFLKERFFLVRKMRLMVHLSHKRNVR